MIEFLGALRPRRSLLGFGQSSMLKMAGILNSLMDLCDCHNINAKFWI